VSPVEPGQIWELRALDGFSVGLYLVVRLRDDVELLRLTSPWRLPVGVLTRDNLTAMTTDPRWQRVT